MSDDTEKSLPLRVAYLSCTQRLAQLRELLDGAVVELSKGNYESLRQTLARAEVVARSATTAATTLEAQSSLPLQ
ncbi:MAG TPA: hypothetical protein VEA41_00030 [Salinarimonas sp.]|nr:hypothetical protein [Salinarimonas sp.]